VLVGAVLLLGAPTAAALAGAGVSGLLVRVQGDILIDDQESADLVVVVSGDATVYGRAGTVVVVGGNARLSDARVGRLVVVRGAAELGGATVVLGDVWLLGSRLEQDPAASVGGTVRSAFGIPGWRWVVEEPVLALGMLGLVLLTSLASVAAGAGTMRRATGALASELPGSLGAALLLFLLGPALAVLLFFTVVGLPLSVFYLAVALPALGLLGWAVAALRLGEWLLPSGSSRSYGAVLVGTVVLAAAGLIPFAGQVLVPLAGALGAGALAVSARRASRGTTGAGPEVEPG